MSQSAVVLEQCLQQPFELSETVTLVTSSTGAVQPLWNTDRRRCCVTVEQHTSPRRSSGVGACWCQRWATWWQHWKEWLM